MTSTGGTITPAQEPTRSRSRFAHIDAMRAVAVLLVVVGHAGLGHVVPGGAGVTIFFAISGFIITTLLLKEWGNTGVFDVGGFYIRRLVKLMPPLVVVLIVPTLIYAVFGGVINWNAFAGQILFYFNWIKLDHPDVFPGSAVVWSLSIEEQFYIVFAILWVWLVKSRHAVPWLSGIAALVIIASTTIRILIAAPGNEELADRIYYGSDTRADSLAWGIVAAIALYKWQQAGKRCGWFQRLTGSDWSLVGAILLFLVSLAIRDDWFRQTFRYSLQSVATCAVVIYGFTGGHSGMQRLFAKFCGIRAIQLTGLASYSIYLIHLSIIMFANEFSESLAPPIRFAINVVLSIAAGIAIYLLIEVPARAQYEKFRDRRRARRKTTVFDSTIAIDRK